MPDVTAPPTRLDLIAHLGVGYVDPGDTLDVALQAAVDAQAARCIVDPYDAALFAACLRRAAAVLAATNAPLGVADLGEFGTTPLPRWDAITERLESAYLRPVFG